MIVSLSNVFDIVLIACFMHANVHCYPAAPKFQEYDDSTLVFLHFLHRHGDRASSGPYTNDPYDASYWPAGYSQLTEKGKRQMYNIGRHLRFRYSNFLNESFYDSQYNARSTDVSRALMSAESLLAGLFPPKGIQIWNDGIPWQPIPVHTVAKETDTLLYTDVECPLYDVLLDDHLDQLQAVDIPYVSPEFCDYLYESTGDTRADDTMLTCAEYAGGIWSTLYCEDTQGLPLPDWTSSVYPHPLADIQNWYFTYRYSTTELARLKSGYLLYNVIQNLREYTENSIGELRVQHYSAHDTTVAPFMSLLGISNDIAPPFGATLLMELHTDPLEDYVLKFFYLNETDTVPYPLRVPNCGEACPLDEFYELTSTLVLPHPEKECYALVDDDDTHKKWSNQ